jgi:glycosyltransferase involved in cell wall biosynthesis
MNLAINALSARQGGGQIYLSNILRYAYKYPDIRFYVLTTREFAHLFNFDCVNTIMCNISSNNILSRMFWEKIALAKLLEEFKIDLVFCPGGTINFTPPKGCRTAVTFQNMLILDKEGRRKYPIGYTRFRLAMLEKLTKKSFQKADQVIFLSEYAKKVTDEILPDRKGQSVIIPHGLDESFRTANKTDIPRCSQLPEGEYLLYVSVIHNFKSQIEVVRAYNILCNRRKTEEKLLFVGPVYKRYEKLLRREINKFSLQDKVKIIGPIPYSDMPSVYHYAKAHIFASTCENCPNVVIESLGSGRPMFLSNIRPMPETAGSAAIYFNPYNPEQLAGLLLKYIDDEKFMTQVAQKAFQKSLCYDWSITADQTFDAFRNLFNYQTKPQEIEREIYQKI